MNGIAYLVLGAAVGAQNTSLSVHLAASIPNYCQVLKYELKPGEGSGHVKRVEQSIKGTDCFTSNIFYDNSKETAHYHPNNNPVTGIAKITDTQGKTGKPWKARVIIRPGRVNDYEYLGEIPQNDSTDEKKPDKEKPKKLKPQGEPTS